MTRIKLKTLELQNTKTKNLCSFQKKSKYPIFPLWNFTQKNQRPSKWQKKIEDSEISNYKNKKLSNFTWRKAHTQFPHLWNFTQNKFENPQNDKKKIKNSETSKYKNKKLSKFTRRKANNPLSPLVKLHTTSFKTHKMTRIKIESFETSK